MVFGCASPKGNESSDGWVITIVGDRMSGAFSSSFQWNSGFIDCPAARFQMMQEKSILYYNDWTLDTIVSVIQPVRGHWNVFSRKCSERKSVDLLNICVDKVISGTWNRRKSMLLEHCFCTPLQRSRTFLLSQEIESVRGRVILSQDSVHLLVR